MKDFWILRRKDRYIEGNPITYFYGWSKYGGYEYGTNINESKLYKKRREAESEVKELYYWKVKAVQMDLSILLNFHVRKEIK